jgi:hypothetical protein
MIEGLFYFGSLLALICTVVALTRTNAAHA